MEFLKGSCKKEKSERCEYCVSNDFCCSADIKHIPKSYPDAQRPGLHYLATKDTLTRYIAHHNLGKYGTKKAKLKAIKENIIQELTKRIQREEDGKSDNQSSSDSLSSESENNSEEEDCVLAEIGISSSEGEEESTEEEEMIEGTENFNVNTTIVYTQSGRRATRIQI